MKTKCSRCGTKSILLPGTLCGRTDAWNTHPCNGTLRVEKPGRTFRQSLKAGIVHLKRLEAEYERTSNPALLVELRGDIKTLEYYQENI